MNPDGFAFEGSNMIWKFIVMSNPFLINASETRSMPIRRSFVFYYFIHHSVSDGVLVLLQYTSATESMLLEIIRHLMPGVCLSVSDIARG